MSYNLKWIEHINNLTTKIRKLSYAFKQLRSILNENQIKKVYKALVESTLTYGIIAWGAANKNNLNKLQITQNNILRIILHKNHEFHVKSLYEKTFLQNNSYFLNKK
jgi:RNA polymerase-interacting CarD/CdnL/TRCF family regulator